MTVGISSNVGVLVWWPKGKWSTSHHLSFINNFGFVKGQHMNVSCNITHCLYSKIHMHRETAKTVYFGKLVNPNDGYHVSK